MKVRLIDDARKADEAVTAIYVRVTKAESVEVNLSIPNQKNRAVEICGERAWSPVKLYVEPRHVSGKLLPAKRPALAELLADVEAGRVKRVLVRHTDRLWRHSRVQEVVLDALRRHGVELWDFNGQREHRSAGGRFSLQVLGAAAELEVGLASERVKEMKRGKAIAGKVGGGPPPFGYVSQSLLRREHVAHGMSEDDAERTAVGRCPLSRAWYVEADEAKVVILVFDLYVKQRWGSRRISGELNRRGMRRRGGHLWGANTVSKVINNPAVAGFTSYDEEAYEKGIPSRLPRFRQKLFQGTHPAIIPPETWLAAQELKSKVNATRLRTKTSPHARVYPLVGILKCAVCGSPMRGKSSGAGRNARYVCPKRADLGTSFGCAGPTVRALWAEETALQYLDRLFRSPEMVAESFRRAAVQMKREQPQAKARLVEVRAQVTELEARQRKWMEKYEEAKDEAASEIVWTRLRELKTKQLTLAVEAAELEGKLAAEGRTLTSDEVSAALARIPTISTAAPEKRRVLVERLAARHDLRVHLVDERRLAVTLRLDEVSNDNTDAVGQRLVLVGGKSSGNADGGQKRAHLGPMCTGAPKPVDTGRTRFAKVPGFEHTEILAFEGARAELVSEWADRMNATPDIRPRCACGCGEALVVLPRHRSMGLPRYVHGHHPNPLRRAFAKLRQRGYRLVSDVAKAIGVSATTLRRMEAAGMIPKAKRVTYARGKDARAYTAAQVNAMAKARERWRKAHPGRWRRA